MKRNRRKFIAQSASMAAGLGALGVNNLFGGRDPRKPGTDRNASEARLRLLGRLLPFPPDRSLLTTDCPQKFALPAIKLTHSGL